MNETSGKNLRKAASYARPTLREYGTIQGLTAGGTGAVMETGMGMNLMAQGPPPFP